MVVGILALAAVSFYTALVVVTQIDHIFFPGNEIRLGGLAKLPGIESGGSSDIGGRRLNVLVMGMDRRPSDGDAPSRTDTLFVMTIDPGSRTARGLAMPRDLEVQIPTGGGRFTSDRINSAYAIGEVLDLDGGGIGTVKKTVEHLLDLKVDYYVMIDFEGFKEIINLLGGIDVDVLDGLGVDDPFYSETEALGDYYPCVFTPGRYHMDGSQALCYARVRRNSDDRERIIRQQTVIYAVMDKIKELQFLTSVQRTTELYKKYKSTIKTDVNDLQIGGFAALASSIDDTSLSFLSLGAVTVGVTRRDGAQVLVASQEGIKQIRDAFLSDGRLEEEAAFVEVQNGTGVDNKAAEAVAYFEGLGIPSTHLVPATAAELAAETEIIVFTDKHYTASLLANWLKLPGSRVRKSTPADAALRVTEADIVVILGSDAKIEAARAP
jgi:polyisoprenyl-teichoic acid--peptidoglycan teichoic acid transferase